MIYFLEPFGRVGGTGKGTERVPPFFVLMSGWGVGVGVGVAFGTFPLDWFGARSPSLTEEPFSDGDTKTDTIGLELCPEAYGPERARMSQAVGSSAAERF